MFETSTVKYMKPLLLCHCYALRVIVCEILLEQDTIVIFSLFSPWNEPNQVGQSKSCAIFLLDWLNTCTCHFYWVSMKRRKYNFSPDVSLKANLVTVISGGILLILYQPIFIYSLQWDVEILWEMQLL